MTFSVMKKLSLWDHPKNTAILTLGFKGSISLLLDKADGLQKIVMKKAIKLIEGIFEDN